MKNYSKPQMEVITYSSEDIISLSSKTVQGGTTANEIKTVNFNEIEF